MKTLPFQVAVSGPGFADAAWVGDGDPREELLEAVVEGIGLDVKVTVGEVTMPLTMWRYPDHWATDWAQECGEDFDVDAHLAAHVGERSLPDV